MSAGYWSGASSSVRIRYACLVALLSAGGCSCAGATSGDRDAAALHEPDGSAPRDAASAADAGAAGDCSVPVPADDELVFEGDLVIASLEDVEAAQAYTEITGALRVERVFAGSLELPALRVVGGSVLLESDGSLGVPSFIERLSLPSLTRIDGDLWIELDTRLQQVEVDRLQRIGGRLYVHRNPALRRFDASALSELGEPGVSTMSNNQLPDCIVEPLAERLGTPNLLPDRESSCTSVCGLLREG